VSIDALDSSGEITITIEGVDLIDATLKRTKTTV
jgi:uncharacterized protein